MTGAAPAACVFCEAKSPSLNVQSFSFFSFIEWKAEGSAAEVLWARAAATSVIGWRVGRPQRFR
jgi:hypothetical protein